jgi:hypothetical protein
VNAWIFPGKHLWAVMGGGAVDKRKEGVLLTSGSSQTSSALHCNSALIPVSSCGSVACAGADVAIIRRTQSALSAAGEPAVHFSARFAVPSTPTLVQFLLFGAVMMTLAKWSWGRALLLK